MRQFRAVILDYPKNIIHDNKVKDVLADIIQIKQVSFAKTDDKYISLGSIDMVSTHFLIYEVTDMFDPKLVFAIRTTYQDRAYFHKLKLPIDDYSQHLPAEMQSLYQDYRKEFPQIVDVNSWVIDPTCSFKNSQLNFSEFGFFCVVQHLLRRGFQNFCGTTNEKYKASRWVEPVGEFKKDLHYKHPLMPDPHLFVLITHLKYDWFLRKADEFKTLFSERIEIGPTVFPEFERPYLSDSQVLAIAEERSQHPLEINAVSGKRLAS